MGLNQVVLVSKELNTLFYGQIVIYQSNSKSCGIFLNSTPSIEHSTVKLIKLLYVLFMTLFYLWIMFQTHGCWGGRDGARLRGAMTTQIIV